MQINRVLCAAVCVAVSLFTEVVEADFIALGPPSDSGSWSQNFTSLPTNVFYFLSVTIVSDSSGMGFDTPGMDGFSGGNGWANYADFGLVQIARDVDVPFGIPSTGDVWDNVQFTVNFASELTDDVTFQIIGFDINGLSDHYTEFVWDGELQDYTSIMNHSGEFVLPLVVPIPPALLIGMTGLGGVAFMRRRRKGKPAVF